MRRLAAWTGAVLAIFVIAMLWARLGPLDASLVANARQRSITVVDRNGEMLFETATASGMRSEWLSAGALPERIVRATLAAEDRRFFSHSGVDLRAVLRAATRNARAMRVVEGGSTITQQVAKLLLQSGDRGLRQKARESLLAWRLEHRMTKREILALYLNLAPYGNRIGGVARASRTYFGVEPERLTTAQAAFLAALPQRPSGFNPLRDPEKARGRQLWILEAMGLSPDALNQAKDERLTFSSGGTPLIAMHFVENVLRESAAKGAAEERIETTLDAALQRDVRGIISMHRRVLLRHGARSVAVAVLDNRTGEWLAWEGSGDYFGGEFGGAIDGVSALRQPGSTLKPFTYAAALESGVSPSTVLPDIPSNFPTAEQGVLYAPRNYDNRYRGPMAIRAALAGSQNVPAVAMLAKLGPETLLRFLRNSGFESLDRTADYYGLGLTLGDAEVSLRSLIAAYAMFARGGEMIEPVMIRGGGKAQLRRRLIGARTAFWISDVLSDAGAREYAFGSGGSLELPFTAAVKTGTSQAYRDNWTIGYTRDLTVGVWVGNFDRSPLRGSSGVTGAAPIFNAVMLAAVKRLRGDLPIGDMTPIHDPPPDMTLIELCTLSGARPSTSCPDVRREWLPTTTPPTFCTWHHATGIRWPPEYRAWAAGSHLRSFPSGSDLRSSTPLGSHLRSSVSADSSVRGEPRRSQPVPAVGEQLHLPSTDRESGRLAILNPAEGATFLIDPTLRREFQALQLRAAATAQVEWSMNGQRLKTSEWPLAPGNHTVSARTATGEQVSVNFFVR